MSERPTAAVEWPVVWQRTLDDLRYLVSIDSVSSEATSQGLTASAAAVARAFADAGAEADVVVKGASAPTVLAAAPGPSGAPRVLLYAHHDVQPPGPLEQWTTPPFCPREREGRLFARGAADNKSAIAIHLAALRWFAGRPPVNVVILIEGEEEIGSPNLVPLLEAHADRLTADVVVIVDGASAAVGEPTLTTSTRGLLECDVTVRTLTRPAHSGLFGGAVPDAVTVLVRLLATLHDAGGRVAVRGLRRGPVPEAALREDAVRADAGLLPGVELGTAPSLEAALWQEPAITPIALDVPSFESARNALEPVASARLSVRITPDDEPATAFAAISEHLHRHVEHGASLEVELGTGSGGWTARSGGPAFVAAREAVTAAWGEPPAELGLGGSLPLLRELQQRMPKAEVLVLGIQDPGSGVHGIDESIDLGDLEHACRAEIELLDRLAAVGSAAT